LKKVFATSKYILAIEVHVMCELVLVSYSRNFHAFKISLPFEEFKIEFFIYTAHGNLTLSTWLLSIWHCIILSVEIARRERKCGNSLPTQNMPNLKAFALVLAF